MTSQGWKYRYTFPQDSGPSYYIKSPWQNLGWLQCSYSQFSSFTIWLIEIGLPKLVPVLRFPRPPWWYAWSLFCFAFALTQSLPLNRYCNFIYYARQCPRSHQWISRWEQLLLFTAPQSLRCGQCKNHLPVPGHRVTIQTDNNTKTLPFPGGAKNQRRMASVSDHSLHHTHPRNKRKARVQRVLETK